MSDGMLIVCSNREFGEKLSRIIASAIPGGHTIALSGAEARRRTGVSDYGAVLIAGKLQDENMLDLALELSSDACPCVVIMVDRQSILEAHEALDGTGVTILAMPITKDSLIHSLQLILRVREGGGTMERAKLMLMQLKNYTEPQAHRYIQKLSMDKRLPREVTAQMVIRALEKEKR